MVTAKREIMLNFTTQYKLGVFQGLVVEQPIQFCPLCWNVAVLVLYGDAVDGKNSAIIKLSFQPVGVHAVAAGKHFLRGDYGQNSDFVSFELLL